MTVSPATVLGTENWSSFATELLSKLVMSSELETPESVAASSVGRPGAEAMETVKVPTVLPLLIASRVIHLRSRGRPCRCRWQRSFQPPAGAGSW